MDREMTVKQIKSLLDGETNFFPCIANTCAVLFENMGNVNWVGFYFVFDGELVLASFQGKAACIRIPLSRGVCGAAATKMQTIIVDDVHKFPTHIACDCASNSEIVVPMIKNGKVFGVLDIDSPVFNRFDDLDAEFLGKIVDFLVNNCDWTKIID